MANRLAGQRRLIDLQCHSLKQFAIGRHLVAGVEHHDIAHDHLSLRHFHRVAIANHDHRLFIVDLIENFKLFLGLIFEIKRKTGGEDYSHKDTDWLEEDLCALVEPDIFI